VLTVPTRRALDDLSGQPHATVFPEELPRTIRLSLDAGEGVDPHSHPGHDVILYCVRGGLDVSVDDETVSVTTGDAVHVDGDRSISPLARKPSTALVVLARRPDGD
jgi:redox-sensitive bicupin YhaK (pirin superfamily)